MELQALATPLQLMWDQLSVNAQVEHQSGRPLASQRRALAATTMRQHSQTLYLKPILMTANQKLNQATVRHDLPAKVMTMTMKDKPLLTKTLK